MFLKVYKEPLEFQRGEIYLSGAEPGAAKDSTIVEKCS